MAFRGRIFLLGVMLFALLATLFSCNVEDKQAKPPNVLLILTDDQGAGDFGFANNPWLETPVLDQLANDGVLFKNFYVSPVCAPTRASLLTGRYHHRTGVTGVTRGRENMSLNEQTLADVFKANGYKTGCFGKWHNGSHYPYHPLGRGFDEFTGFTAGHYTDYFNTHIEKNGEKLEFEGYLPDFITDSAIDFMTNSKQEDTPFFCYVPFNTPHTPAQVPDKFFDKYKAKGIDDLEAAVYGMCENIDFNVGRLLQTLDKLNLTEETLVIFLSDNGPANYRYNNGLKGKKAGVDEGGVKVPLIVRWPNRIPAGRTVDEITAHIDILPTLQSLLSLDYEFSNVLDGKDLSGLLASDSGPVHDQLFENWWGRHRLRTSQYLLVDSSLYDLEKDPEQRYDLADTLPDIYSNLQAQYEKWNKSIKVEANIGVQSIPVGYTEYPVTTLPAHEAVLYPAFPQREDRKHTGIAYYAQYGWAHDWIDHWTKTEAHCSWPLDVVSTDTYHVYLRYNCSTENVGCQLKLNVGEESLITTIEKSFYQPPLNSVNRIPRGEEAPERNWGLHYAGEIKLSKGNYNLELQTLQIAGDESVELKEVLLAKGKRLLEHS